MKTNADVVVIGGGLAGLTCAVGLSDSGLRVVVLERDAILGGRASSWIDSKTGDPIAIGPHILLNQYHNMLQLLDRLGTRGRIVWQAQRRFLTIVDGQCQVVIRNAWLPAPYHFMPSLLRDPHICFRDLLSNWPVVQLALEADEELLARLDSISARDFLQSMKVNPSFIERFWAFAAFAIMNVPLEQGSAGALLRFYRRFAGHRDLAIGFADGGLADLYAPQAHSLIENSGGQVITSAAVKNLLCEGESVKGVELEDGSQIHAKFCVAALPPQALRQIIPTDWVNKPGIFSELDQFEAVPYISVYLWFDRKLTQQQFWARSYSPNDLNCDFYDLSNIYRGWQKPSLIASNIIYAQRAQGLNDQDIITRTLQELAEFLPQVTEARVVHSVVNRIPLAIPVPSLGSELRRPATRTWVKGLFLAGDWIQTRLPYSMESAVASGWLAAEVILDDIGAPRQLAVEERGTKRQMLLVRWVNKLFATKRHSVWLK